MSVFDDHSSSEVLSSFEDKQILELFKISNSGSSLIPRKGIWGLPSGVRRGSFNLPKLPPGVYHREDSLGKIIFGSTSFDFNKYVEVIRNSGLEMMTYRGRYFYVINRDQKRWIRKQING